MSKKNIIPSAEEFAQASRFMDEQFRGLNQVQKAVILNIKKSCALHEFHILPQDEGSFRAYVFLEKESNIVVCKRSRVDRFIIDCVYNELERAGRGRRGEIKVEFEFDSHENVVKNYEGNYFLRLR